VIRRLALLWIALQAEPAWADHPTPLQSVPLSRTAAALTLAAMLVIIVLIGVALIRLFTGARDESERQ
jgi:negative regulator of sigma E activity